MSTPRPKSRRREWTLSPRDLPDPRLIDKEPTHLASLENNAAYRLLIFRERSVPFSFAHPVAMGVLYLIMIVVLAATLGGYALLLSPFAIAFIQIAMRLYHGKGSVFLLGITEQHLHDLSAAGQSPRDTSRALWGYQLRSRTPTMVILCVSLAFAIWMGSTLGILGGPLFLPLAFAVGFALVRRRYEPYISLIRAKLLLDECVKTGRAGGINLSTGCGPALLIVLAIVVSFAAMVLSIELVESAQWNFEHAEWLIPSALALGALIAGILFGFLEGLSATSPITIRNTLLDMEMNIAGLMELASKNVSERGGTS